MKCDVAIIGGGVAGLTAALFLDRAKVSTVVVDHGRSIARNGLFNNYPGLASTPGGDLLKTIRADLSNDISFVEEKAQDLRQADDGFLVVTDQSEVEARFVILASGSTPFDPSSLSLERAEGRQPYVKYNIEVDRDGRTAKPGLFAVGILAGAASQAVVCAGSGAAAAIAIASDINGEFWVDHDEL